jgi:hypothetical protein
MGRSGFVALVSKPVAGVQEMWSCPRLAIGPIPTLASNSKHCLDKELQIHGLQVPAKVPATFDSEQPDKSLEVLRHDLLKRYCFVPDGEIMAVTRDGCSASQPPPRAW